jgi:orotate phosphoribosyltransferase
VGAPLRGRVVIVDDVISSGAAKREAIEIIRAAGAEPVSILLALDRQERGEGALSAVQEVESEYGVRCVSIITLTDLIDALSRPVGGRTRVSAEQLTSLQAYRDRYGVR